jgi:hypothetical protein
VKRILNVISVVKKGVGPHLKNFMTSFSCFLSIHIMIFWKDVCDFVRKA